MSKKNICDIHDSIQKSVNEMYKIKPDYYDTPEELFEEVKNYLYYIDQDISEARDAGQSMENRLSEYRNAIEDLGFRRV